MQAPGKRSGIDFEYAGVLCPQMLFVSWVVSRDKLNVFASCSEGGIYQDLSGEGFLQITSELPGWIETFSG
jgi:hypothetical protein